MLNLVTRSIKSAAIAAICIAIVGCGSTKKQVPISVLSDPLGAYAMIQVEYKKQDNSDWIFLGPTPVQLNRTIKLDGATRISLRVIKDGFYEQTKSWEAKKFLREYKKNNNKVIWSPSLVQN